MSCENQTSTIVSGNDIKKFIDDHIGKLDAVTINLIYSDDEGEGALCLEHKFDRILESDNDIETTDPGVVRFKYSCE